MPAIGFGRSDEGRGGGDKESVDEAVEEEAGHPSAAVDLARCRRWKRRCSASASSSSCLACFVPSTASRLDVGAIDEFERLDAGGGVVASGLERWDAGGTDKLERLDAGGTDELEQLDAGGGVVAGTKEAAGCRWRSGGRRVSGGMRVGVSGRVLALAQASSTKTELPHVPSKPSLEEPFWLS